MPTLSIKKSTPTIGQILQYTYNVKENRFDYMERDVLKKVTITLKHTYNKEKLKQSKASMPDQKLEIKTSSYPQYPPYNVSKDGKKQKKIKHHYDITIVIQKNLKTGEFDMGSKIIWRVGSFKKWKHPNQRMVKSIQEDTKKVLKRRYKDDPAKYKKAIEHIKRSGKYLNEGDYNSQVNGINGDFYYRVMPLAYVFNCLYGPATQTEFSTQQGDKNLILPFFDKHMLRVILFLLQKGILKKGG
jgi:hypothetical protein